MNAKNREGRIIFGTNTNPAQRCAILAKALHVISEKCKYFVGNYSTHLSPAWLNLMDVLWQLLENFAHYLS